MLNGAAVMDAALLLVAGNETCPQPQTSEHLAAVEIMRLKHIIILQNKVELIKEGQAAQQHEDIKKFVAGTVADGAPVIPISAVLKYNVDVIAEYLTTQVPIPPRVFQSAPQMIEIRPGVISKTASGQVKCRPIQSVVRSLLAENNQLQYAVPGGLIGVGTQLDPTLTRADRLVGP